MLTLRAALSVAAARTAISAAPSLLSTSSIDVFLRPALLRPSASPVLQFIRKATHKSEGRANGPKDGPGKRLGAKKGSEEYVIPGNIIFRQRGTGWHPGENTALGRDHCIYATQPGYVKFYRDPARHPKRRYIGVTFNREDRLPYPPHAARRRRLGMVAVQMKPAQEDEEVDALSAILPVTPGSASEKMSFETRKAALQKAFKKARKGYAVREANWEIGRAAEQTGVRVRKFKDGDRYARRKRKALRKKDREEFMRGRRDSNRGKKKKRRQ